MKKTTSKQCLKIPELVTAGRFTHGPGRSSGVFYGGGAMGAKAWSKATEEQRVKHRASCQAAGKERRMQNFVRDVFANAGKIGVDGGDYLAVWGLIFKNNKFPPCDGDQKKMIELLQRRQGPVEIYREIFNEAPCRR